MLLPHALRSVQKVTGGQAQVEYINTYFDDVDRSSYTFSSIPVTPGLIVVSVHADFSPQTLNSVTIEGNSATEVANILNNSTQRAALFQRATTTTGNISVVVSFSSNVSRCAIGVWRVYDNSSNTAVTSQTAGGLSQPSLSVTLNSLPSGSVVIAASTHGTGGVTSTWTNVTERYDSARESTGSHFSGADGSNASGNYTVTDTYSSSTGGQALAAAAWN